MSQNPQTGEEIKIPASKKVTFRAAKSLKQRVEGTPAKKATSKQIGVLALQ
jgi:DNA-binding protein HU-beta